MKQKHLPTAKQPRQASEPTKKRQDSFPWRSLEQQVVRMQKRITQAAHRGDLEVVYALQQRLLESEPARLLAVRRVAEENQGKDTAGVDGVKSLNPKERLAMAAAIHPNNWKSQPALPVRRVWIPKSDTGEQRPISILPMLDRCKQALVKLALEPEWEARFEAHSYGFRPGRSAHDAIAAIVVALERRPMFVYYADIAAAFDHVDHVALLSKLHSFPALQQMIHTWLKAGVMDGATYAPSTTGIAQGGILSPLLMNVALHGMETVVRSDEVSGQDPAPGKEPPLLVRYADNFVIAHPDLSVLQRVIRRVRHWLASIGLHLNATKSGTGHALNPYRGRVGFDFLGFHLRQEEWTKSPAEKPSSTEMRPFFTSLPGRLASPGVALPVKTVIEPSQEAIKRHLAALDQRLQAAQAASQAQVIGDLNPLIVGWVAYYNGMIEASLMSRYDDLLEQRLIAWASKRHPGQSRDWLFDRYWQRTGKQWVFATPDGVQLQRYQPGRFLPR